MLRIYVDAATKGNPGPSGGGIVLVGDHLHEQIHVPLGECSNHEAEFKVFIKALQLTIEKKLNNQTVVIHSDSKIVVQTIEKQHAKNLLFQPYLKTFQQLEQNFALLLVKWLPENQNKGADSLARQALQKYQ
ncbi:ribonuclease HI family protein [Enterococcus caccae]|uniref:Cell wall enzyme ebsB n=1 Tax=Enterococcus caccae ATCC BAA-1240 TaxID=1158612 RepID=R3W9W2_9ENTE|nr:ribonuclease HI family protein [Enterococcus caccae]EOL44252.1 cell wall enzyme ebsB [Enterococcus caccae ATCC BAA-1240]EOT68632.1 cell wall enzyme ebsB [Enterococcus caccae ATCC BAA-1240]OJG28152.1 cell wall enzyme ebsB [Enterococcus caccae]